MKRKQIRIIMLMIMAAFVMSVIPTQVIAAEVPGAPVGFNVTSRDRMVTLAWSEPEDDGGSDITGYRIYRGILEDGLSIVEDVTDMTYTNTGLQNDQTYYYAVSALNAEGESEKTQILPATPQGDSPLITEIIVGEFENIHIIYVGEGVHFNLAGETYTVVVESVSDATVTFFVDWGGIQSFTMSEGDSENIDANGDGKDDFKITCVTIISEPAEGFPQTVKFSFTTKNLGGSSGNGNSGTPGFELWTLVVAGVVALSVVSVFRRRRK